VKLPRSGVEGPLLMLAQLPSASWAYGKTLYAPELTMFGTVQVRVQMPSVAVPEVSAAV